MRAIKSRAVSFVLGSLLTLLTLAPAFALSNYATDVLAWPSLVGFWQLGETVGSGTAADSSASGITLTAANVTFGSTALEGTAATSASFNGSTSNLIAASSSSLNYEYTQPFAIEAIEQTNLTGSLGQTQFIYAKQVSGGTYAGYSLSLVQLGGSLHVQFIVEDTISTAVLVTSNLTIDHATHHIYVAYGGCGHASCVQIKVDGLLATNNVVLDNLGGSILNSAPICIGSRDNLDSFFSGNIQYVAVYNLQNPGGFLSGLTNGDLLSNYHANLLLAGNDPAPPTLPGAKPNVIMDDDPGADISGMAEIVFAAYLHKRGLINLIGYTVDEKSPYSATVTRATLDYYGLTSIPVLAYQGSGGVDNSMYYAQITAAQFRPQDGTNLGIVNGYTVSSGGTLNAVNDILTFQGGTLCPGGSAAQIMVTAVSSGAITAARQYRPGCYTSAPSSPATLNNLHSGTAAALNISTASNRGLYEDMSSGIIDLLGASSNVWILNSGNSFNLFDWYTNNSALVASKVQGTVIVSGFGGNSADFCSCTENNMLYTPSNWATIFSSWPVPIIVYGVENSTPDYVNNGTFSYLFQGPAFGTDKLNPMTWAYVNGTLPAGQTFAGGGYLRQEWEFNAFTLLAYGLTPGISNLGGSADFQLNRGTNVVNSSSGKNAFNTTSGTVSYIRRNIAAASANSIMAQIMALSAPPNNTMMGAAP